MKDRANLNELEHASYRIYLEDGIIIIHAGIWLLLGGLLTYTNMGHILLWVLILIITTSVANRIRQHHIHPRVGYVKLREEDTWGILKGLILCIGFIYTIIVVLIILQEDLTTSILWSKWSPMIFGMLMVGILIHIGMKTAQVRYYILGLFAIVSGLLMSMIEIQNALSMFLFSWGIAILTIGIATYVSFFRKYPSLESDADVRNE